MSRLVIAVRLLVIVCVVLVMAISVAWPYSSQFTYPATKKLNVTATVTWISDTQDSHYGLWKYQYVVAMTSSWSPRTLNSFTLSNTKRYDWVDAYNTYHTDPTALTSTYFTTNPVYVSTDTTQTSVTWSTQTPIPYANLDYIEFGYYSRWNSGLISASSSGASGYTLGMVPEPGTLAAFGLGLSGMAGYLVRGARRRRK